MRTLSLVVALAGLFAGAQLFATAPVVLKAIAALPVTITASFSDPVAFAETASGQALVLNRQPGGLFSIDAARRTATRLIGPGPSPEGLTLPSALAIGPNGFVGIADVVNDVSRIQYFTPGGQRMGGFYLPDRPRSHVVYDSIPLDGISSFAMGVSSVFVNLPTRGWLVSEVDLTGKTLRQFGQPRGAGSGASADVAALLNLGIPLVDPAGGFYFVFRTGLPTFRKYDDKGTLLFERHIEGRELDAAIGQLPTEWVSGPGAGTAVTQPLIRTAAVDSVGQLWISFAVPYTYVYDRDGDKVRTVQFEGAGVVTPRSLFFALRDRVLVSPGGYEFSSR